MDIQALLTDIIDHPLHSVTIILNLVLIESLLSVDNAAVLATMVMSLNKKDRARALSLGIIGAYIFRGLCLFFASFLIKISWLKAIAGGYLIYLFVKYFINKSRKGAHSTQKPKENRLYRSISKIIGPFWATVLSIELMDLTFSIDNVFAAVAFTNNIILVWVGVFIGILAMRMVARVFVVLIERYPFLETAAFIVLGVLGIKLVLPEIVPAHVKEYITGEAADLITSLLTVGIFVIPLLSSRLFNIPKHKTTLREPS